MECTPPPTLQHLQFQILVKHIITVNSGFRQSSGFCRAQKSFKIWKVLLILLTTWCPHYDIFFVLDFQGRLFAGTVIRLWLCHRLCEILNMKVAMATRSLRINLIFLFFYFDFRYAFKVFSKELHQNHWNIENNRLKLSLGQKSYLSLTPFLGGRYTFK